MTWYYKTLIIKFLYIKAPFIYTLILEIWKIKNIIKLGINQHIHEFLYKCQINTGKLNEY